MAIFCKKIHLKQDEIIHLLDKSKYFNVENDISFSSASIMQNSLGRIYLRINNNRITFAESGGLNLTSIIGEISIIERNNNLSNIEISYKLGIFNMSTLILILFNISLLCFGLIFKYSYNLLLCCFLAVPPLYISIIIISKYFIFKSILKDISYSLKIDNKWDKYPS